MKLDACELRHYRDWANIMSGSLNTKERCVVVASGELGHGLEGQLGIKVL